MICRLCGRTIALSPASGLWWATDRSEPDCPHEPREGDSDDGYDGEPGELYPDVVVIGCGLASPWDGGPYSRNRPARRPSWRWGT